MFSSCSFNHRRSLLAGLTVVSHGAGVSILVLFEFSPRLVFGEGTAARTVAASELRRCRDERN